MRQQRVVLASLLINADHSARMEAIQTLQAVMARLLTSLPPGRVRSFALHGPRHHGLDHLSRSETAIADRLDGPGDRNIDAVSISQLEDGPARLRPFGHLTVRRLLGLLGAQAQMYVGHASADRSVAGIVHVDAAFEDSHADDGTTPRLRSREPAFLPI